MTRYACIVADPPWQFGDRLPGPGRGAAKHYTTMSLEGICNFPLPPITDDAWLFLWRVAAMQAEALLVADAWGFTPKSEIVWIKQTVSGKEHFGMGRYVRAAHEVCLIGVRGKPKPLSRSVRSTFVARVSEHSRKPDAFFSKVEQLSAGPYIELFARRKREGWTCLGLEVE